ncbi:MAG: hypothetical protein IH917_11515 [Acidobacteria bacterium]|nr:hypothetical protein [Acidobacteriota bacterium]
MENPADKPSQPTYLQAVRSPTTIALIVANLVPLVGVLFFDWSLFTVMFCFWLESAVIGVLNILKLVIVANILSIIMVPFFVVHYGAFMSGHLVFIFALFAPDGMSSYGGRFSGLFPPADLLTSQIMNVWPAFLGVSLSHGISFFYNFIGKKEFRRSTPEKQMMAPYGRIILMHLTIIFGGWLILALGAPILALVLLIVLKIVSDVRAHHKEHAALR